jgi:hypothetical protein
MSRQRSKDFGGLDLGYVTRLVCQSPRNTNNFLCLWLTCIHWIGYLDITILSSNLHPQAAALQIGDVILIHNVHSIQDDQQTGTIHAIGDDETSINIGNVYSFVYGFLISAIHDRLIRRILG